MLGGRLVPDMISELLGWISSPWYRVVDHISSVRLSCCWLGSTKRSVLEGLSTTDIPIPGESSVLEKIEMMTIGKEKYRLHRKIQQENNTISCWIAGVTRHLSGSVQHRFFWVSFCEDESCSNSKIISIFFGFIK